MTSIVQIIFFILEILWFLVIAHVIMSWLINFQVLNIRQPLVAQVWYFLERILEPIYGPIRRGLRRIMPDLGGIDISPLIVIIVIFAIRTTLWNNMHAF